jgi:hypothetical protein
MSMERTRSHILIMFPHRDASRPKDILIKSFGEYWGNIEPLIQRPAICRPFL